MDNKSKIKMVHIFLVSLILVSAFTSTCLGRQQDQRIKGCCNNCPRDDSPRRQLSKRLLSNDTVVQGDYCPMGLLSKEVFTSEKLAQIIFSYFLLEVTRFIDYRISKKNNVNSLIFVN